MRAASSASSTFVCPRSMALAPTTATFETVSPRADPFVVLASPRSSRSSCTEIVDDDYADDGDDDQNYARPSAACSAPRRA